MFQLIVAVISIALIAALAIASIFYGGDAFTKSSEKANVTTLINQAQQIAGAAALYKTDAGKSIGTGVVDDANTLLVGGYLAQSPSVAKVATGAWYISQDTDNKLYAVVAFKDGVDTAAELCRADDAGTADIDERGEVLKQNGLCVIADTSTGAVSDAVAGVTATHFAFPL